MPDGQAPLTAARAHALFVAGHIPRNRYREAIRYARDEAVWSLWARRTLLALAVAQILAGIVFFFAYNWASLPPFTKLAVLQAGIVLAVVAAWLLRRHEWSAAIALVFATVMVGVLLAVFGQVYQTGADAHELFSGWAVLTFAWAVAGRSAALWLVWLAVANAAALLYGAQVGLPDGQFTTTGLAAAVAGSDALFLAAGEWAAGRGAAWAGRRWARLVLVAAILGLLLASAIAVQWQPLPERLPALGLFAAGAGMLGWFYHARRPDFAAVAMAVLALATLLQVIALVHLTVEGIVVGRLTQAAQLILIYGGAALLLHRLRALEAGRQP